MTTPRFGLCCDCTTTCEDASRPICYVDKYAAGAGDGSSWTDAYTTIQSAVAACAATHRIYIKGYGVSDIYAETVVGYGYAQLVGQDDAWIQSIVNCQCVKSVTCRNTLGSAFIATDYGPMTCEDCASNGSLAQGFYADGRSMTCRSCSSSGGTGYAGHGFRCHTSSSMSCTDCDAHDNAGHGFFSDGGNVNCDTCVSDSNASAGFYSGDQDGISCVDCDATDNGQCGYYQCDLISGNTESGNGTC